MCVVERGCFDVSLSPDRLSTIVSSEIDPIHHHHLFFGSGWGAERSLHYCQSVNTTTIIMIYITVISLAVAGKRPARRDHNNDHDSNDHSTRAM